MPQQITYPLPLPHAPKNLSASLTSWGCVRWNVATSSSAERSYSSVSFRLVELNHRTPPTQRTRTLNKIILKWSSTRNISIRDVAAMTRSPVNCGDALRYAPSPASVVPNDSNDASWMRFSQSRFENHDRTSSVTTVCRAGGGPSRAGGWWRCRSCASAPSSPWRSRRPSSGAGPRGRAVPASALMVHTLPSLLVETWLPSPLSATGRHIVNILSRSFRGITFDSFQQSELYARAKSSKQIRSQTSIAGKALQFDCKSNESGMKLQVSFSPSQKFKY